MSENAAGAELRVFVRSWWPVAVALVVAVLFTAWCAWLILDVTALRGEVADRVAWLTEAQSLQRAAGRDMDVAPGIAQLQLAARDSPEAVAALAGDPDPQIALDAFIGEVRRQNADLSGRLGSRWFHLYAIALLAVMISLMSVSLLALGLRARGRSEALARELEAHLDGQRRLMGQLAHELRGPTGGVVGMSDLLLREPLVPEVRQRVEVVRTCAEALSRLVADLTELGRAGDMELALHRRPYDLLKLVRGITAVQQLSAGRRDVRVRIKTDDSVPSRIVGDAQRVGQVVSNLVSNAVKFTDEGEVAVVLSRAGDELRIVVRDPGTGILPAELPKLFEPLQRLRPADGRVRPGTGLGMSVVKRLVDQMDGRVEVESVVGKGTTVGVFLPLQEASPLKSTTLAGLRVLVVDDDLALRMVVSQVLESLGAKPGLALTAGEGMTALGEAPFDLLLVDYELPDTSGPRFARQARSAGFEGPIVALTGRTDAEAVGRCRDAGMNEVLFKPFSIPDLVDRLEAIVDSVGPRR